MKARKVPHAEVTKRVIAELRAMSVSEVRTTFIASGILRPDGTLASPYDGSLTKKTKTKRKKRG